TTGPAAGGGIARAVVTTYAARFASMIAYVALLPIVLMAFGADAYGLYVLTVALGSLFQQDLGIGGATTRFIGVAFPARDVARMREVASASTAFFLAAAVLLSAASALAFAAAVPSARFGDDLIPTAWMLCVLGVVNVFVLLAFSSNRQILAGIGRLDDVNYLLIGLALFRIVATIVVCWAHLGIVAVAVVDVIGMLGFGIATFVLRRLRAPQITASFRQFRWSVFRELFHVSAQLMVVGVAGVVIMQAGGVLTALLLPIAFTAMYAAGQRIYLLVKEVTGSIATAVLPTASMRQGGAEGLPNGELFLRGTSLANMLMMLVLVPVVTFMPMIMTLWLGPGSAPAAIVAQILVLSLLANNNHLLAIPILTAQGSLRGYAILHTVWAVTGTVLAAVLGSALDSTPALAGIALGLTIPVVLLEPIYVLIALRRLGLSGREFVVRCLVSPFLSTLPLAAGVYTVSLLDPSLVVAVLTTVGWVVAAVAVYWCFGKDGVPRPRWSLSSLTRKRRHPGQISEPPRRGSAPETLIRSAGGQRTGYSTRQEGAR
ncbi:lipopolysaccharide biosynthesis protein, partial [Microbacterium sp.]|uniref:lipopolysaccharide biosynthesis protein n=1 Tax=Microbacterium sp. TaxID=51671 RepID=UPI003C7962E4